MHQGQLGATPARACTASRTNAGERRRSGTEPERHLAGSGADAVGCAQLRASAPGRLPAPDDYAAPAGQAAAHSAHAHPRR